MHCRFLVVLVFTVDFLKKIEAFECGDGDRQSPIKIDWENSNIDNSTTAINFFGCFKDPETIRVKNYGLGVAIFLDYADDMPPNITGGPLGDNVYIFDHLHLHWEGSEHLYSGKYFSAEMHLVHFNSLYDSIEHASMYDDGFAVLGLMYSYDKTSENNLHFSEALEFVTETGAEYTETEKLFNYADVLTLKDFNIASYLGSLTTPPYCENVIWLLAEEPLSINEMELEALKSLRDINGNPISHIRPIQAANGRTPTVFPASTKF